LISVLALYLSSCMTTEKTSNSTVNLAALYNPSELSVNADFRIYHISELMSTLYIRLYPGELLFNQANDESEYRAMVKLDHSLFELNEQGKIVVKVDSASNLIKLGKNQQEHTAYLSSLILPIPEGKKYLLKIEISDLQRGTHGLAYLQVDKTNKLNFQNFSVVSAGNAIPKFMDYHRYGEVFSLRYTGDDIDSIYLDFFKDEYDLPRPPVRRIDISSFPVVRDTTIVLPYADSIIYTLPGEGMYQFRIDSTREEGLTIFNFGENYPQVKNEEDMIEPLFYIAYPVEYTSLMESRDSKIKLDEFWLRRSSNVDRSRELIRIYYNRVLYSNIFFTADREGWKTDRGLVYILFGPPDRMKDSGTSQIWYYISRRRSQIIEFKFNRGTGYYTNEGFYLEKNQHTMRYLNEAIGSWNKGKVHSLRN
jgi:GWxTD domain-containing protein